MAALATKVVIAGEGFILLNDRPLEDWEYPDPDEIDDEEFSDTVTCPLCGADIYEDAEQCSACGDYIVTPTTATFHWNPWLIALGVAGGLGAILMMQFLS